MRKVAMRNSKLRNIKWLLTSTYLNINLSNDPCTHMMQMCIYPRMYMCMLLMFCCCWFYNKQNKMWLFDLTKYLKYEICKGDKVSTAFHIPTTFTTTDANPTCRLSFIVWPPEALNFQLYACYFLIIVAS